MIEILKQSLWKQFGASIDMLKNAIALWPEERWDSKPKFFYIAYHTLFFLDYYLTIPVKGFSPRLAFTLTEPQNIPDGALDDLVPSRIYSKGELLSYLQSSREKCHTLIAGLTEERLNERWIEEHGNRDYALIELLFYNMRHVQHHAAQLNMLLRTEINFAPDWVSRADDGL
ncbi:MAG: DinB family protein [Chryseolinea sp.]